MWTILRFTCPASRAFLLSTAFIASFSAWGQATPGSAANSALGQLATAFAGGQIVHQVQLSGNAIWYAGALEDSGSVTLTASADGSYQMQLGLAATGQRTESQAGSGSSADCQWVGADGVAHETSTANCWRPMVWFMPAISLQPSRLSGSFAFTDLGNTTVGSDPNVYRDVRGCAAFSNLSPRVAAVVANQSMMDIGLDLQSSLPSVIAYAETPDSGPATAINVEIHYSDYRAVNGVQIPFQIQRFVNGSLQLQINVSTVQVG